MRSAEFKAKYNEEFAIILLDNYFITNNIEKQDRYRQYLQLQWNYRATEIVKLISRLKKDGILPYKVTDFEIGRREWIVNISQYGVKVGPLLNPEFNTAQFKVILKGLKWNCEHKYHKERPWSWYDQQPDGIPYNIDVESYADPKYTAEEMESMYQKLISGKPYKYTEELTTDAQFAYILLENYFINSDIKPHDRYKEYKKLQERYSDKDIEKIVYYLQQDYILPFKVSDFTLEQRLRIKELVKEGIKVGPLLNPKFSDEQRDVIEKGLMWNYQHKYGKLEPYGWYGERYGDRTYYVDVKSFADPKYTPEEMMSMFKELAHSPKEISIEIYKY